MNWIREHLDWRLAAGVTAIALVAAGGTALAAGNGGDQGSTTDSAATGTMPAPPPMPMGPDFDGDGAKGQSDFAAELAGHLDGVSTAEVSKALDEVAARHESEMRSAMAKGLAAQLDGVSVSQIEAALEKADGQMQAAMKNGTPPDPGALEQTIADELGLTTAGIEKAMHAAAEKQFAHDHKGEAMPAPPDAMGGSLPPMPGGAMPAVPATPPSTTGSGAAN